MQHSEESMMAGEIELVHDGDGIALIGDATDLELFLVAEGLESAELDLTRLLPSMGTVAAAAQAGAQIVADSGRWVRITEKSAQLMKTHRLMTGSADGLNRAVFTTDKGKITGLMEIVSSGPGQLLTNPAVLAGVGGIMAQMAMQQAMDDITDYLAAIDKKVDDILRAQKDAVLAEMIGVGFVLDEAMTLRRQVGRVSETTWSKVQGTGLSIASAQAYALRQLDALAEKLERESRVDDLAKTLGDATRAVQEWLVVLARCFQLQDVLAVLELDRVLDASADELDHHRRGLTTARANRRELIARSTMRLLARMDAIAGLGNGEILLNPFSSQAVVRSIDRMSGDVVHFREVLGVVTERDALEAKGWTDAAVEVRDGMIAKGAESARIAARVGSDTVENMRRGVGKFAGDMSKRLLRQDGGD